MRGKFGFRQLRGGPASDHAVTPEALLKLIPRDRSSSLRTGLFAGVDVSGILASVTFRGGL